MCVACHQGRQQQQKEISIYDSLLVQHHERGSSHWSHSTLYVIHFQSFQRYEGVSTTFPTPPLCYADHLNEELENYSKYINCKYK